MARQATNIWCSYHGVKCDAVGYRLLSLPNRLIAESRATTYTVPGRDGDLVISEGAYKAIEFKCYFEATESADFDAFAKWLTQPGDLIFSDMTFHIPGDQTEYAYAYSAQVIKSVPQQRGVFLTGRERYEVTFFCNPLKHSTAETTIELTESTAQLAGQGDVETRPVITVYGSGDITLMINTFSLLLSDVDEYITIDCESMMALKDGVNVSQKVTIVTSAQFEDDFPWLKPTYNEVSWVGNLTKVEIMANWRWR